MVRLRLRERNWTLLHHCITGPRGVREHLPTILLMLGGVGSPKSGQLIMKELLTSELFRSHVQVPPV